MKRQSLKSSESKEQLVGDRQSRPNTKRLLPVPVTVSGVSCVSFFWILCTFLLLCGLVIAGGFPNWIANRVERNPVRNPQRNELSNSLDTVDLGLYYLCFNLTACTEGTCSTECATNGFCGCHSYLTYSPALNFTNGDRTTLTNMRRASSIEEFQFLFAAGIIFAFGVGTLMLSLIIGIFAFCKPRVRGCSMFVIAFVFQITAG